MKVKINIQKCVFSALFLALALVLPFLTGQIPEIGSMLCPMHIPVLLCGFICSYKWGFAVGLTAPLLRSVIFNAPPMFPAAVCMAPELAVYGLVAGVLHSVLPKKPQFTYVALLGSMIVGRIVYGLAMFTIMGLNGAGYSFSAFISSAVLESLPGIIIQIVLIPPLVIVSEKMIKMRSSNNG